MLKRLDVFTRFLEDGRICLSNTARAGLGLFAALRRAAAHRCHSSFSGRRDDHKITEAAYRELAPRDGCCPRCLIWRRPHAAEILGEDEGLLEMTKARRLPLDLHAQQTSPSPMNICGCSPNKRIGHPRGLERMCLASLLNELSY